MQQLIPGKEALPYKDTILRDYLNLNWLQWIFWVGPFIGLPPCGDQSHSFQEGLIEVKITVPFR